jgi:organic hydroperoxide reductase OsmC/OhrA
VSETHTVSLKLEEGYRIRATFESVAGAPSLVLDEPEPLGAGTGPNAQDLLAAAIGNCLAASLIFCLRKSRADVTGLEARVTTDTGRTEGNRLRINRVDVELAPKVGEEDAAKMARCAGLFEDFCTVTASLKGGLDVRVNLTDSLSVG